MYAFFLFAMVLMHIYINNIYTVMILLFSIFLPLISICICLFSKKNIELILEVPNTLSEKEEILKLHVANKSIMPIASLNICITVFNCLTGTHTIFPLHFTMSGKSEQKRDVLISDPEIGKIFFDTESVSVSDMFHLISIPVDVKFSESSYGFPKSVPTNINMLNVYETYGESLKYSENQKGNDRGEVFDLKEYQPGDDVRNIHWKLSAKSGRVTLREFSFPLNYSVVVMVEFCADTTDLIEACATIASNISKGLLDIGVMHTFVFFDAGTEELSVLNIDNYSEHDACVQRMVSSVRSDDPSVALTRYYYSLESILDSQMIYITTNEFSEIAEKLSTEINIKHVMVTDSDISSITIDL